MDVKAKWGLEVSQATADYSSVRTGVDAGGPVASSLVGVDGNEIGGLRPFPPFELSEELEYGFANELTDPEVGGFKFGGSMLAIFHIRFKINTNKTARGILYAVQDPMGTSYVWRLKINIDGTTLTDFSLGYPLGLLGVTRDNVGEQHDVAVLGRYVYVFSEGLRPFMFYLTLTGSTYSLSVVTETGPGKSPLLVRPSVYTAACLTDLPDVEGALSVPTTGEDAYAQLLCLGLSGLRQVSSDGINDEVNPNLPIRSATSPSDDDALTVAKLNYWDSAPCPEPSWSSIIRWISGSIDPIIFPVPPSTYNERHGWGYNQSDSDDDAPIGIQNYQAYVWAYRLYDSRTGRLSPMSQLIEVNGDSYSSAAAIETIENLGSGKNSNLDFVTFPLLRVVYDKNRFDTIRIYRGVRDSATEVADTPLFMDREELLSDWAESTQPGDTAWGASAIFCTLSDAELAVQSSYNAGADTYLEQMPYAGAALNYEGCFVMGAMGQLDDSIGGSGKAVWSSLQEITPELVSPSDRYVLQNEDEEVIAFKRIGPNVVGFTRSGQYLFRREMGYMRAQNMHEGYGLVGQRACCTVGSQAYAVAEQTLMLLASDGSLQDITRLSDLPNRRWASSLASTQMAFDSAMGCIFWHNPVLFETAIIWLKTGRISMLYDTMFEFCFEGTVLFEGTGITARSQRRALFVGPVSRADGSAWWNVYTVDYSRNSSSGTMMPTTGLPLYTVATGGMIAGATELKVQGTAASEADLCTLYVLTGEHTGKKIRTQGQATSTSRFRISPSSFSLEAGTVLGLSPVFFEYLSGLLPPVASNGQQFDNRTTLVARVVNSVQASFTDVSTGVPDQYTRFYGVVYIGNGETPYSVQGTFDASGAAVRSVGDGLSVYGAGFDQVTTDGPRMGVQGSMLFAGIQMFVPSLDYRLQSILVHGSIRNIEVIPGVQ